MPPVSDDSYRNGLPPSVRICEVLDGPYAGHVVRVSAGARHVDVRPMFSELPLERYEVVEVSRNVFDLRHAPDIPR